MKHDIVIFCNMAQLYKKDSRQINRTRAKKTGKQTDNKTDKTERQTDEKNTDKHTRKTTDRYEKEKNN